MWLTSVLFGSSEGSNGRYRPKRASCGLADLRGARAQQAVDADVLGLALGVGVVGEPADRDAVGRRAVAADPIDRDAERLGERVERARSAAAAVPRSGSCQGRRRSRGRHTGRSVLRSAALVAPPHRLSSFSSRLTSASDGAWAFGRRRRRAPVPVSRPTAPARRRSARSPAGGRGGRARCGRRFRRCASRSCSRPNRSRPRRSRGPRRSRAGARTAHQPYPADREYHGHSVRPLPAGLHRLTHVRSHPVHQTASVTHVPRSYRILRWSKPGSPGQRPRGRRRERSRPGREVRTGAANTAQWISRFRSEPTDPSEPRPPDPPSRACASDSGERGSTPCSAL